MTRRLRLDSELVKRGYAKDAKDAVSLITAHRVIVAGSVADNASRMIQAGDSLHVVEPPPKYVGRGGHKLEAALARFQLDPSGRRAIDVGASTGGFTDCLLQNGASSVLALDVGRGQLHERLVRDPRVTNVERTNIKDVTPDVLEGARFDLLTADVSFISLKGIAGHMLDLVENEADLIVLVKPQFEATHDEASAGGGVITDAAIWRRALESVLSAMTDRGAATMGVMASPIRGAEGNVEFLAWLQKGATSTDSTERHISRALAEV